MLRSWPQHCTNRHGSRSQQQHRLTSKIKQERRVHLTIGEPSTPKQCHHESRPFFVHTSVVQKRLSPPRCRGSAIPQSRCRTESFVMCFAPTCDAILFHPALSRCQELLLLAAFPSRGVSFPWSFQCSFIRFPLCSLRMARLCNNCDCILCHDPFGSFTLLPTPDSQTSGTRKQYVSCFEHTIFGARRYKVLHHLQQDQPLITGTAHATCYFPQRFARIVMLLTCGTSCTAR